MFIELTDHLRCTADHDESFLVLLPGRMTGRRVAEGTLGCHRCGRIVPITDGVVDFGGGVSPDSGTALDPVAVATFVGLEGPGGYLTLIGPAGGLGAPLGQLLPGIRLVLVNPPRPTVPGPLDSLVSAGRLPVKSRSMRAVVVSGPAGLDPAWVDQAADAVLPGNRLVVEGPVHRRPDLEILMESPGLWVARKISGRPGDA